MGASSGRLGLIRLPAGLSSLLIVLLVPFVVLGLLVLIVGLYAWVRYDPAYFSGEYLEEYGEASEVARSLERALQTGNRRVLSELQGLRWPAPFETNDNISFVKLWERTGRYVTYLYVDMYSYERYEHHLEQVQGRWVVAPEDLRYLLYSGQWKAFFFPAAIAWWVLALIVLAFVWRLRHSESLRSRLLGL